MKFIAIFALTSALTMVAAAPTPASIPETTPSSHPHQLFKRWECPSYYASKGSCNGTSCRWGLVNYNCDIGSCVGSGGGDGSCCGWPSQGGGSHCPNGGW